MFNLTAFTTDEMVKIKVLCLRNKYYKDYPMLKKEDFSEEDEKEIETFLSRTKHPILLKYRKSFDPEEQPTTFTIPPRADVETAETYSSFAFSYQHDSHNYFN